MNKPLKHAQFIKAWADGAEIEYKDPASGKWCGPLSLYTWGDDIEYRIKPEPPKYPQTQLTGKQLAAVWDAAPSTGGGMSAVYEAYTAIANAALAHAIESGQVYESIKFVAGHEFVAAVPVEMVPAAMLEKVYKRAMEAAAYRLKDKSWSASPMIPNYGYGYLLDELLKIDMAHEIATVRAGK